MRADRYPVAVAEQLSATLGMSYTAAAILARRGYSDPDAARTFLAADERHDPERFRGIEVAGELIRKAIDAGRQITVYGDFDADGVCATTVAVETVRTLGGECDWFIPDRIDDGYGLNPDAVRMLAERGTELLLTVDCGVTAMEEVDLARKLGLDVIVTDHHQPDSGRIPDCPVLHPALSDYPFPELCGTAVAAKLAAYLRRICGADAEGDERDLDLVALATVADVMPLIGENRRLVRQGIEVARRARRPGMAALMEECRVTPEALVAEDFGFRLAPRINAAGRMYRADAGVELFLSDSRERAGEIAAELGSANAERRRVERQVLAAAEVELDAQGAPGAAIVVAGQDWHPGVVGIVASRLVQKHGRPSVVIALDGERGRGSARSVPGLDLHETLGETATDLLGYGGHAAAAGLRIAASRIDSFRGSFEQAVASRIGTEPMVPEPVFDAVAGGEDLGLPLAEELAALGPFGNGNPTVRLLIPGARVSDQREMGEGRHCRFTVQSGANRATGVCFGRSSLEAGEDGRLDLLAELSVNHWNGSVEPRLVVRESVPPPPYDPIPGCEADEWWERFEAALAGAVPERVPEVMPSASDSPAGGERQTVKRPGLPGVRIGELISSGAPVAVLTADAPRRWRALGGSAGLGRFNPDATVAGLWEGSPGRELAEAAGRATVLLTDYPTARGLASSLLDRYAELVLLDPPSHPEDLATVRRGPGRMHLVSGPDEWEFALAAASHRFDLTADLRELYAELRGGGAIDEGPGLSAGKLRRALSGPPERPRSPERAALLIRVLEESGLLRGSGEGDGRVLGVVSSVKVELTSSAAFGEQIIRHKERIEFLKRSQTAR